MTNTELKIKGFELLAEHLGDVESERFISLIQSERFDYTEWRKNLDESFSIEEISRQAMKTRENQSN